jgi:acyl-CoA synthetase (AMP-forming)/AMP-acid ligase II
MAAARDAMRDAHGGDVARVSGQGQDRSAGRHGLRGRYSGARRQGGAAARVGWPRDLRRRAAGGAARPETLATVIFSSGSTGIPKGVMLSHYNVLANIEAMAQLFWIGERDRIVGVLPFFHSFGYTVTIWFPLIAGCGVVYHPNPTDAKAIGELIAKYRATLPAFDADVLRHVHAQVLARKSSPACDSCWWARRSCASPSPRPSARSSAWNCSKDTAAPKWRRWWR